MVKSTSQPCPRNGAHAQAWTPTAGGTMPHLPMRAPLEPSQTPSGDAQRTRPRRPWQGLLAPGIRRGPEKGCPCACLPVGASCPHLMHRGLHPPRRSRSKREAKADALWFLVTGLALLGLLLLGFL